MMKSYVVFSACAALLLSNTVLAEDELGSLLDEVTEIATKTKLNIDYQPSVVSVLNAETLKKIGIRNLHEALGLLPGIETSILHTGWKQVIIRGAYNPDTFIFDKYKLYVDGVDVGSDLYSTSYYYLDFPVELIDRIEVLRGSASSVYGPGAFSGAINVITKSAQSPASDKLFGAAGSYDYTKAGFVQNFNLGEWSIGIDGYHQHSNKTLYAGEDFLPGGDYSRDDYDSLESFEDYALGFTARHEDWTVIARYKSEVTDNFYGLAEDLEPVTGGYQHNQSGILEVQNRSVLNDDLSLKTKVGLNYYELTFDTTAAQVLAYDYRFEINPTYRQLDTYLDLSLNGQNIEDHDWIVGLYAKKIDTLKNIHGTTQRYQEDGGPSFGDLLDHGQPPSDLVYLDGEYGFLQGDNDQWIRSVYLQDIYALNDQMDISANIRLDDYALFGTMTSYRLGTVYRMNDQHIFKAVYGRSYRAPSYVEAFQAAQDQLKNGNPDLDPESIDTYELAYTYRRNQNTLFRTNFFYSVMKDVIDIVNGDDPVWLDGSNYGNHQQRDARGMEAEYFHRFENGSELMANFSYVRTQFFTPLYEGVAPHYYEINEFQSPEISEVLSKGYYLLPVTSRWDLNTAWYYSGPKKGYNRNLDGSGSAMTFDATMIIDETIVYDIDYSSTLTLSIKNILDEPVVYPSFDGKHDGIRREGRNWLMTYEKRF